MLQYILCYYSSNQIIYTIHYNIYVVNLHSAYDMKIYLLDTANRMSMNIDYSQASSEEILACIIRK